MGVKTKSGTIQCVGFLQCCVLECYCDDISGLNIERNRRCKAKEVRRPPDISAISAKEYAS